MSLSAPSHRFKQPDGSRYPHTRPDGLVRKGQLIEHLGIGATTLDRWQKLGWIAPEKKEGHCTLYRVPTPERIEEIRQLSNKRQEEGAKAGRLKAVETGGALVSAAKGRASKTEQAKERQAQGLLNKRQFAEALGTHCGTVKRWMEEGIIAPALVSESGKWIWFTYPDVTTLEQLRSSAKGRTKSALGIEVAAKSEPTKRAPRQVRTVNIVSSVKTQLKRGTFPAGTISFDEAAERAGVAKETVVHWTEKGWLAYVRESRYVRGIQPEVLDAYLAERERQKEKNAGVSSTGKVPGSVVDSDNLLSVAELCKHLGTTPRTLRQWVRSGWIAPVGTVRYGALRFANPSPETIAFIRQKQREARAVVGLSNVGNILSPEAIEAREKSRLANRLATRPSGCLSRAEVAEALGMKGPTFNKHVQKGLIVEVEAGWIHQAELDRYKAKLAEAMPKPAPKVAALKTIAQKVAPTPVALRPTPPAPSLSAGALPYELAVANGRADSRFQTVLGFNLLAHPQLGFRAAVVNEKPEQGWRYHERHFINGYGQWQVKAQKALTGEIVL